MELQRRWLPQRVQPHDGKDRLFGAGNRPFRHLRVLRSLLIRALARYGYTIRRIDSTAEIDGTPRQIDERETELLLRRLNIERAHYGCGTRMLADGWLNVDRLAPPGPAPENFVAFDLAAAHPFPSDWFAYAYAEDFLEHLSQADSLIFLSETYRTLRKGGVLRLSFPGFEGVLERHFRTAGFDGAAQGKKRAYTMWDHLHFYSRAEIATAAERIGFSAVQFVEYGNSRHETLTRLDSRPEQREINIYVELTK